MTTPAPDSFKLDKAHPLPAVGFAVARVPGSARCFVGGSDFTVSEIDFAAAKFTPAPLYSHASYVTGVALAGRWLVSGGYDGRLVWWDTTDRKQVRSVAAHAKWVRKVVASPDGRRVASVADDIACKVWDAATGQLVHDLRGHAPLTPTGFGSMLYAVAFSADGKHLATGDKVGHVVVWDAATGKELAAVEAPVMYTWDQVQRLHSIGGVRSVAFSPDGQLLAVGGTGKIGNIDHLEASARVEVFEWRAGKRVAEIGIDGSKGLANRLAWAPDGGWLLAAGGASDGFFAFLDVAAKKVVRQEKAAMHVHDFVLTEDATAVYAVGHNKAACYKLG